MYKSDAGLCGILQQTLLRGGTGFKGCAAQVSGSGWPVDCLSGNMLLLPSRTQANSTAAFHLVQVKQLRSQLEGQRQAHEHELALLAAHLKQDTELAAAKLHQEAVAAGGAEFEGQLVALQQAQAAAQERLREWRSALLQQQQEIEAESAAALASMKVCCFCQCLLATV